MTNTNKSLYLAPILTGITIVNRIYLSIPLLVTLMFSPLASALERECESRRTWSNCMAQNDGENCGRTTVEPWLAKLTKGNLEGYQYLIDKLDAGILPIEMDSAIVNMQSSLPSLSSEFSARNPKNMTRTPSQWAIDLNNRLNNSSKLGMLPSDDVYWEFAHFVAQARGAIEPGSEYQDFHREGPSNDAKTALDKIRDYMKQRIELTIKTHFLGEFSPLSIKDINRMEGLRIFPVGLTLDKEIEFDGGLNNPSIFAFHDYAHAIRQIAAWEMVCKGLREKKMMTQDAILKAFEDTQLAFREFMSDLESKNAHLAMGTEAIFFDVTHEDATPIEPTAFITSLERVNPSGIEEKYGLVLSKEDFEQIIQLLNGFFERQRHRFEGNV